MRLAPTGVPALGAAAAHFAAGEPVDWLTQYANLPDPPQTDEQRALAAKLSAQLGSVLGTYIATRARDRDVDLYALQLTAEGALRQPGPIGRQARIKGDAIVLQRQSGEAEHRHHPEPAKGRDMDPAGVGGSGVRQIDRRGPAEIAQRHLAIADLAATNPCMAALSELPWPQRGS